MKNILFVLFFLPFLIISANSQDKSFLKSLEKYSLTFRMPVEFEEVSVVENHDVVYDYAVRNKTGNFEIRYRIWPVDTSTPPPNETRFDPNKIFPSMLETMMLNISGGIMGKHGYFDSAAVKKEFNAISGATGFVNVNSVFGKGYSYCMLVVIHQDNLADVYIFFMFNDKAELHNTMGRDDVFHAIKFK